MAKTKEPRYKKFLGLIYIGISAVLIYTLAVNAFRVVNQKQELVRLETRKAELEKEKKALSEKVDLLTDDDYAARYARDEYIFPKDGEEVVRLPDTKK
ncbi:FtsB family cell division protein [Candidatus Stoquefichus massiliensis]|uniref:FtsB family cell division protein n=1 Tax=Candidatus Stoquefichus massiliensis TaxID=1470350 RepID=UPI0004848655|nr:septum formation initiator family protein [Candidatus Stoquefichus massiliensis]